MLIIIKSFQLTFPHLKGGLVLRTVIGFVNLASDNVIKLSPHNQRTGIISINTQVVGKFQVWAPGNPIWTLVG